MESGEVLSLLLWCCCCYGEWGLSCIGDGIQQADSVHRLAKGKIGVWLVSAITTSNPPHKKKNYEVVYIFIIFI